MDSAQTFLGSQPQVIQSIPGIESAYRIAIDPDLQHIRITCPDLAKAQALEDLNLRGGFYLPPGYRLVINVCPTFSNRG
jgi:Cu/Ag efflux pump CusA